MGRRGEGVIGTQWGDGATEMVFFEGAVHTNKCTSSTPEKKNKAEFGRCRGMGKFCPHATASPKLLRGNKKVDQSCTIGGKRGGGGNGQNWQVSAPPSPKIVFLFWSYVLENAGSYFKKEKKQADSKTAILISG